MPNQSNAEQDMPDYAEYPERNDRPWDKFPIGVSNQGQVHINISDTPSILLTGSAGSGKTVIQRSILAHCQKHYNKWNVIGFDFSKCGLAKYENLGPAVREIVTEIPRGIEVIHNVHTEMMNRYLSMKKARVCHFKELKCPPKATLLMIDEFWALVSPSNFGEDQKDASLNTERINAKRMIEDIARLGERAGFYLIVSLQRPTTDIVSENLKQNLSCRIVCGNVSELASLLALGNINAAAAPRIKGRAYIEKFGKGQQFQAYFTP